MQFHCGPGRNEFIYFRYQTRNFFTQMAKRVIVHYEMSVVLCLSSLVDAVCSDSKDFAKVFKTF